MDGQRARLVTPALDRLPAIRKVAPTPARRAARLLTTMLAAAIGIGWSLAIVVSVALDLVQKINSHLVMRNYPGLTED